MRQIVCVALALIVVGCAPVGGRRDKVAPDASPVPASESAVAKAAGDLIRGFGESYAAEAAVTASKAGTYKSWDEAFDDWKKRNRDAKSRHLEAFTAVVDASTGAEDKFDPDKLREAAAQAEKGFRAIGK